MVSSAGTLSVDFSQRSGRRAPPATCHDPAGPVHFFISQRSGRRAPPTTAGVLGRAAAHGLLATFRASRSPYYQQRLRPRHRRPLARNVQGVALPLPLHPPPRWPPARAFPRNVQGVALPLPLSTTHSAISSMTHSQRSGRRAPPTTLPEWSPRVDNGSRNVQDVALPLLHDFGLRHPRNVQSVALPLLPSSLCARLTVVYASQRSGRRAPPATTIMAPSPAIFVTSQRSGRRAPPATTSIDWLRF